MEKRTIKLPKGGDLEMLMSDEFKRRVRKQFDLCESAPIDDDHIRMFVFGSLKGAIEKEEQKCT